MKQQSYQAGIDIGSTTTKIVVIDPDSKEIIYSEYRRHNAAQVQSVRQALSRFADRFPGVSLRLALTGSGAQPVALYLDLPFVQEVVANAIALKDRYDDVRTAIELGGQDAKMIFFHKDKKTGNLNVSDMRMNGSCAGGTGAFIDEIAAILKTPIEEFNALAEEGDCVYDISGRCGVYAKTDIQPLLNQGANKADIAASIFQAVVNQTIAGLAQGRKISGKVMFLGGPLSFCRGLRRRFQETLKLDDESAVFPDYGPYAVARGAALYAERAGDEYNLADAIVRVEYARNVRLGERLPRLFSSEEELLAFR